MVVMYLTSDADSDMGSPHNSLLMLARSSDSALSSKHPRVVYTAVSDVKLGPHDSETLNYIHPARMVLMSIFSDYDRL